MPTVVEKEVIRPGCYWYRDEATGQPRKLVVTPELTRYWHEQGNAMLATGLTVPVPCEHDFSAHPMTPAEKLKNNVGWVRGYSLKGDKLFSSVEITDPDIGKKLKGSIRWTSPWINSFADGNGKEWKNVISHLALTTRPRIVNQQPFGSIAAALSVATETVPSDNYCLSRAGLLRDDGQPEYPIAFSLWGGVAASTDTSGHEHDKSGRFSRATKRARRASRIANKSGLPKDHASAAVAHERAAKIHAGGGSASDAESHRQQAKYHSTRGYLATRTTALATEHDPATGRFTSSGKTGRHKMLAEMYEKDSGEARSATDKAHGHTVKSGWSMTKSSRMSRRALKHAAKGDHDKAAKAHRSAAKDLERIPGGHEEMVAHLDAARAHSRAHSTKSAINTEFGAAMAIDMAKGKKPPPAPVDDDDDADDVDSGVPGDLDDDADTDADDADMLLDDANGDIAMEELLCDLLQALGVPMPDESNEQEFKRHLYEAVMSKIKELTSQGLKRDQDKDDPTKTPDQNKPPHQNPNTSHPSKAPNPLIQQEQQPMYMSLEDINKIEDATMKAVALSMYNENVKLRSELEAGQKTANSLRDAKLREENAKRSTRVALLGRLSPKVKADLDAMLALPAMALSMGDGGEVVDPMAQTLAILEKGLNDMPRLLTTDQSAFNLEAHPKDADEGMSEERSDELADMMARKMGCPPVAKAG